MRLTEKVKSEKHRALLDAGLKTMILNGYHGTSIKDITSEAGMPKGSFFNYFVSKEAFAQELIEDYADQANSFIEKSLIHSSKDPRKRIIDFFKSMGKKFSKEKDYREGCLVNNMCQEMADIELAFAELIDSKIIAFRSVIKRCILEGQESGSIASDQSAETMSIMIDNMYRGTLLTSKAERSQKSIKVFNTFLVDLLEP